MANPASIASPLVVVENIGTGYRVSVWAPPAGIWRLEGEPKVYPDIASALMLANGTAIRLDSLVCTRIGETR